MVTASVRAGFWSASKVLTSPREERFVWRQRYPLGGVPGEVDEDRSLNRLYFVDGLMNKWHRLVVVKA